MELADVIARASSEGTVRYGTVTASSSSGVDLQIAGEAIPNLPWLDSYTPALGDRVAVLSTSSGWLVLGKVTAPTMLYDEPTTIMVEPDVRWYHRRQVSTDGWDGYYEPDGTPVWDPNPVEQTPTEPWVESPPDELEGTGWYNDPRHPTGAFGVMESPSGDSSLINYSSTRDRQAVSFHYPNIADRLPSGAVVHSISFPVRNDRNDPVGRQYEGKPVLWVSAHALSPSTTIPSRPYSQTPVPFVSGFTDWEAGRVEPGQIGSFTLPEAWATAFLSGTLTGLTLYGPPEYGMSVGERTVLNQETFEIDILTNYQPLVLRVSYSIPYEAE